MLDGVPPAAIRSLQLSGYLPVELAFSLGTDALSGHRHVDLSGRLVYPLPRTVSVDV